MTLQASGRKMSLHLISEHVFASWKTLMVHTNSCLWWAFGAFIRKIFTDPIEKMTVLSYLTLDAGITPPNLKLKKNVAWNDWKFWKWVYLIRNVSTNLHWNMVISLTLYRISWPSLTPVYQVVGHYLWPMKWAFPTTIALMTAKAIASAKWV